MTQQLRGQLTKRIEDNSKELLGYSISQEELRLMAYIQYVMVNSQTLEINKISPSERKILNKWREKEYIDDGASGLGITREFWDIICEIIFLGYVNINNYEN